MWKQLENNINTQNNYTITKHMNMFWVYALVCLFLAVHVDVVNVFHVCFCLFLCNRLTLRWQSFGSAQHIPPP